MTSFIVRPDQITEEDGVLVVEIPRDEVLEIADAVDQYEADADRIAFAAEQVNEETADLRANLGYELRGEIGALLAAAEFDRLEDQVGTTDVLLYGPVVAAVRAAMDIVTDVVGTREEWRQ